MFSSFYHEVELDEYKEYQDEEIMVGDYKFNIMDFTATGKKGCLFIPSRLILIAFKLFGGVLKRFPLGSSSV
jgi:hypothetical protein